MDAGIEIRVGQKFLKWKWAIWFEGGGDFRISNGNPHRVIALVGKIIEKKIFAANSRSPSLIASKYGAN